LRREEVNALAAPAALPPATGERSGSVVLPWVSPGESDLAFPVTEQFHIGFGYRHVEGADLWGESTTNGRSTTAQCAARGALALLTARRRSVSRETSTIVRRAADLVRFQPRLRLIASGTHRQVVIGPIPASSLRVMRLPPS
jgi:hypothetical protein